MRVVGESYGGIMFSKTENYFKKNNIFRVSRSKKAREQADAKPSERQIVHAENPFYAFYHFGMNTFTDREWGTGLEKPEDFAFMGTLDTDQWVQSIKLAGMNGVIITAKHHDGFALWRSDLAPFSVKGTGYKGNVVNEVYASSKKHGVRFGFYLSPWDMNFLKVNSNPTSEAYNDFYVGQLAEIEAGLMTVAGYDPKDIAEVWFDGAIASEFRGQIGYDWVRITETVRAKWPNACTAIAPPDRDVAWVGNEKGYARKNINSFTKNGTTGKLYFAKNECDVSIRDGWFYHEAQEPKTVDALMDIYFNSVGKNCTLLLNVPPDKTGRINAKDVERLREFGEAIRSVTANPVFKITEPVTLGAGGKQYIDCTLEGEKTVRTVVVSEDYAKDGESVAEMRVYAKKGKLWVLAGKLKAVGACTMLRLNVRTDAIRVVITKARRDAVTITKLGIYA